MKRLLLVVMALTLSACGSQYITKTDPDTGVCYAHERNWVIWQMTNSTYRVDSKECRP